jgi:transposase
MVMSPPLAAVPIGVGIDTARYGHHVSFLDQEKRSAAPAFHFCESAEGYRKLEDALARLCQKHLCVHLHIRIDAAGQYAENLLQWLHRQDLPATISVGQPARNKAYRQAHYDKRKADPAESLACARFAVVERPPATPHNPAAFQQLRDAVALVEASATQQTRLVNQLHSLLARVFPELAVHVKDLSAGYVLTLLQRYPTPQKLAAAKEESLVQIPHLKRDLARKLQEEAGRSLGSSRGAIAEQMIRGKVQALRQEQREFARLQALVQEAFQALPEGPHGRLRTIPGIGWQTAAALVAKIVSIDRFPSAGALVGYFGVFPEEVDVSGVDREGHPRQGMVIRMCRKGNDLVRRLLYTAAQCAVRHNPPVRALFARLSSEGKAYNVCLGHCMAKLLRQVFAVWTKDCDFDRDFEAKRQEAKRQEVPAAQEMQKVVGHKTAEPSKQEVTTTSCSIAGPSAAGKRPLLNFAVLRQRVSIEQVLEHLAWRPCSTKGNQWRGPCPLHEPGVREGRLFAVHTQKNAYCCHGCGAEGNALDLWAAAHGLPILEAAWSLVETFQLESPLLK